MKTNSEVEEFLIQVALEVQPYSKVAESLNLERKTITQWESENKARFKTLAKVRQIYLRKDFQNIPIRSFLNWYESTIRKCYYCNFTEPEIKELISANAIHTKRLITRGRRLEIERLLPNEKYDNIKNLVFCCYWCNNAKSDEFTAAEFKIIAQPMKMIWGQRLKRVREAGSR